MVPTAAVQALMAGGGASTSTAVVDEEERNDEDRIHYKVVGAGGRGRKRKSGRNTVAAGSSRPTVAGSAGDQTAKRLGKMNVTGEHERDDVTSQQQPTSATQKAALPSVCQQQQPAAATTMEAITTTSRWNQPAAAAGNDVVFGNIAPPTGAANMTTTVTYEPEFSRGGNNQQQQQNVRPPLMSFGPFPYQGPRPPVPPLQRFSGTDSIGGGATVIGASAAGAREYGNAATSLLPTLNDLGRKPDGCDELAAMMAMYTESNPPVAKAATAAMYSDNSSALMAPHQPQQIGHGVAANRAAAMTDALNTNSYTSYSAAAAVAPHVGHGVAPKHAAARQEVLNNGDNFSTYNTSVMAPNQVLDMASNVNGLTMAGGAFFSNANDGASFTAAPPQDLAAATDGDQLAPGALDAFSASLMGSPGHGAAMDVDGNPGLELEAMFSPDQYDNTLFPLEALLGLDDAPVYETGVDYQQGGGGVAGGTAGDAAGTSLIGGADDNLDVLNDYLFMDSTGDFNNGRE